MPTNRVVDQLLKNTLFDATQEVFASNLLDSSQSSNTDFRSNNTTFDPIAEIRHLRESLVKRIHGLQKNEAQNDNSMLVLEKARVDIPHLLKQLQNTHRQTRRTLQTRFEKRHNTTKPCLCPFFQISCIQQSQIDSDVSGLKESCVLNSSTQQKIECPSTILEPNKRCNQFSFASFRDPNLLKKANTALTLLGVIGVCGVTASHLYTPQNDLCIGIPLVLFGSAMIFAGLGGRLLDFSFANRSL
ncbi:MAG: hypothetical protein ACRCUY_06285 [Thermoguttaceae bacterium]